MDVDDTKLKNLYLDFHNIESPPNLTVVKSSLITLYLILLGRLLGEMYDAFESHTGNRIDKRVSQCQQCGGYPVVIVDATTLDLAIQYTKIVFRFPFDTPKQFSLGALFAIQLHGGS